MPSKILLLFLAVYSTAMVGALLTPLVGVWGYIFESCFHPPLYYWGTGLGETVGQRWSLYIGVMMVFSCMVYWAQFPEGKLLKHPQTWLVLGYTINAFAVTVLFAPSAVSDLSWGVAIEHLKMAIVYFCIVRTHSTKKWMSAVPYIYIFGCVYYGWEITTGSSYIGRDTPVGTSTAYGDNFAPPHIVAFLPMVGMLAITPGIHWALRGMCLLGAPLMMNVIAHGSSRGAFLALIAAGIGTLLFSKGRMRLWVIAGMVLGTLVAMRLFNQQFWDRIYTIATWQEDASASNRTVAWADAWRICQSNPLGHGAEAFDKVYRTVELTTHNMFFEIFCAWGIQGVIFFFGFILISVYDCWKLTRRMWPDRVWPPPPEYAQSLGVMVGLLSMLVATVFLNRMSWELWWVFAAYSVCLKNATDEENRIQEEWQHAWMADAQWDEYMGETEDTEQMAMQI